MADTDAIECCPNCALPFLRPKDAIEPRTARVEELLRQNHPPLDVELSDFRKVAEDTLTALEDLESRIVEARELLENLLSARQQAQSRLEDAKSILHPVRSIPTELLAEIFRHCVPTTCQVENFDGLDPRGAPWLFSSVCRRWRELALNSPQLWTHLFLDFDKHDRHITDRQCAYKAGLFIERSKGLPMEVYLGTVRNITYHPVIPVLEVSIPRWRSLDVDLTRTSLQSLSGNSFLTLQKLRLLSDLNVDVFHLMRTPVLQEFEVITGQLWRSFEHVPFPWSHLTSVVDFPAFDMEAVNYLRTMVDLETLEVLATTKTRTPIRDVVSLSKLHCLTITETEEATGHSKEFFSALAIPALSKLTLTFSRESVTHFPRSPLPLGNLTTLDIFGGMSSHEENTQLLLDFLTLTHHVESLGLIDDEMTVEFVNGLNITKCSDGTPVRLPCLRSLDICRCEVAPALNKDLDQLFEMLFSRLPVIVEGGEETLNDNASNHDAGDGQNAPPNETGTELGVDVGSRLDSEGYRRCLKTVRLRRWLYVQMRTEWPDTFLELTSRGELECGVTMRDIDD